MRFTFGKYNNLTTEELDIKRAEFTNLLSNPSTQSNDHALDAFISETEIDINDRGLTFSYEYVSPLCYTVEENNLNGVVNLIKHGANPFQEEKFSYYGHSNKIYTYPPIGCLAGNPRSNQNCGNHNYILKKVQKSKSRFSIMILLLETMEDKASNESQNKTYKIFSDLLTPVINHCRKLGMKTYKEEFQQTTLEKLAIDCIIEHKIKAPVELYGHQMSGRARSIGLFSSYMDSMRKQGKEKLAIFIGSFEENPGDVASIEIDVEQKKFLIILSTKEVAVNFNNKFNTSSRTDCTCEFSINNAVDFISELGHEPADVFKDLGYQLEESRDDDCLIM